MGIEHPQMDAIAAIWHADPHFHPTPDLMDPNGKTPNQRALACAISLAWARITKDLAIKTDAISKCDKLFRAMQASGHQAVSNGYGAEGGCPDPHSELWMAALTTILREARLLGAASLVNDAIGYFADHVAMCRAFWTPKGVRIAGSRAKAPFMQPLRPNWSVDSWAYAELCGLSTTGLLKPTILTIEILRDSRALWPQIVALSKTRVLKLSIPVRLYELPGGGFLSALAHDEPMNDRLSWVTVDGKGDVTGASNSLSNLIVPGNEPHVFGGDIPTASQEPPGLTIPPDPAKPLAPTTPPAQGSPVAQTTPKKDNPWTSWL
jgi:hypothetical protein